MVVCNRGGGNFGGRGMTILSEGWEVPCKQRSSAALRESPRTDGRRETLRVTNLFASHFGHVGVNRMAACILGLSQARVRHQRSSVCARGAHEA